MLQTRATKLLGIRHPIVLPGMSWISKPQVSQCRAVFVQPNQPDPARSSP